MASDIRTPHYSSLSIFMHWLMLALIVAVYATMELKPYAAKGGALREALTIAHYAVGVAIFAAVWLRALIRLSNPAPLAQPGPRWQRVLSKATHLTLYALMLGMPVLGWLWLSAKGQVLSFFGLDLPMAMGKDASWAKLFKQWHQFFANVGYGLMGLHVAAALLHHYVMRDTTLQRMLPRLQRQPA